MNRKKRMLAALAAVSVAVVVGGGIAVAAGATLPFSGDGNTINGCYTALGELKLLTPTHPSCKSGYTPIQWNATGPQGPQGSAGPQGPQGPQGEQGPAGASDVYVNYGFWAIPNGQTDTVATVSLPPGLYTLNASVFAIVHDTSNDEIDAGCWFATSDTTKAAIHQHDPAGQEISGFYSKNDVLAEGAIPLLGDVQVSSPVDVRVDCWDAANGGDYEGTLYATRVGAIHSS